MLPIRYHVKPTQSSFWKRISGFAALVSLLSLACPDIRILGQACFRFCFCGVNTDLRHFPAGLHT